MSVEFEASIGYGFTITREEELKFLNNFQEFYYDYEDYFYDLSSWDISSDIFVGYMIHSISCAEVAAIPLDIFFNERPECNLNLAAICEKLKEIGIDKKPLFSLIQRVY